MYNDLISQAEELATRDAKKPKQANLRRAISAVYYAIFHFLVDDPSDQKKFFLASLWAWKELEGR